MIKKIISGGQVGADIAALKAAKRMGIPTGGWMPKGFKNHYGYHPEYAELYGMHHTISSDYPPRTRMNVLYSDGTLRFAENFTTAGERCTLRCIIELNKPYLDIHISDGVLVPEFDKSFVVQWIAEHKIETLNVAGNAIRRIEPVVEDYIYKLIQLVNGNGKL